LEHTARQFREGSEKFEVDDQIPRRSSGDGGFSEWNNRFLKVYRDFSCAVHFQEAERVKIYEKTTWM